MKIRCTHCGADVPIEETTDFVKCPYCSAALIAQIRRGIEHMIMRPALDHSAQVSALRKGLLREEVPDAPELVTSKLYYFPFWRFSGSAGKTHLVAAAELPVSSMTSMRCPQGDLQYFPENSPEGATVVEPHVLLDEAQATAAHRSIAISSENGSVCLLHLPIVQLTYQCQQQSHEVWIDLCDGGAFAERWPHSPQRKKNAVLAGMAVATFTIFALEAWLLHPMWLIVAYPLSAVAVYYGIAGMLQRFGW